MRIPSAVFTLLIALWGRSSCDVWAPKSACDEVAEGPYYYYIVGCMNGEGWFMDPYEAYINEGTLDSLNVRISIGGSRHYGGEERQCEPGLCEWVHVYLEKDDIRVGTKYAIAAETRGAFAYYLYGESDAGVAWYFPDNSESWIEFSRIDFDRGLLEGRFELHLAAQYPEELPLHEQIYGLDFPERVEIKDGRFRLILNGLP